MRRIIWQVVIVVAVLLATFAGGVVAADEELTLAGLAEQLTELAERLTVIESQLTPNAFVDEDGNCRLALRDRLHATSLTKFLDKYPDSDMPDSVSIENVYVVPGTGIAITFLVRGSPNSRLITEFWSGCDFVSTSDWWAVDWMGNKITE